jgi:hypothetical protein
MTHSQDSASRRMALPRAGFGSAVAWSVSSPLIWHRLNFHDQWDFLFRGAGIELGLRAVHGVNARIA